MIVDLILFLAFVVPVGAAIVKAYEWRQDVLYGPYIFPAFPHQNKRMAAHATDSQVRESFDLNGGAGVSWSLRHEAHP